MINRNRSSAVIAALAMIVFAFAGNRNAAAQSAGEIDVQLEDLGTTLKAAAMSGVISDKDAWEIYGRVAKAAKVSFAQGSRGEKGMTPRTAKPDAKTNVARLLPPSPEQLELILRAEFLRRDLAVLEDVLDLDRDQMLIIEMLFDDYTDAFALASAPLRESIARYSGSSMNAYIAFVLEDAGVKLDAAVENARRADRDEATARVEAILSQMESDKGVISGQDRDQYEAWKQSMIAATLDLDERLDSIRSRTVEQLSDLGNEDSVVVADDLVRLARQLQSDRRQLRSDFEKSIRLIANETQRGEDDGRLASTLARLRVLHSLPRGRLGGESMNLRAALAEVTGDTDALDSSPASAITILDAAAPEIALRLDNRADATINREIAGIDFLSRRDRVAALNGESVFTIDQSQLAAIGDSFAAALVQEVEASVKVRDALLNVLDDLTESIGTSMSDSEAATHVRQSALRLGFPVEMRPRWAEQAMKAASELPDVDENCRRELLEMSDQLQRDLRVVRTSAIEHRINRDPQIARKFATSSFASKPGKVDDDVWREAGADAFVAIDDRIEVRLRALLTESQFGVLPKRPIRWDDALKRAGSGKEKN